MSDAAEPRPLLSLAIDFAPLLVFFLANRIGGIFVATAAFMVATIAAAMVSRVLTGQVSMLLAFNSVMILIFGGLTLWLHDQLFIKIKPTIDYGLFAGILFFSVLNKRPMLEPVFGAMFPDLGGRGWLVLTRNWAFFFLAMALVNELLWRSVSTDLWVTLRTWGMPLLTLGFGVAHIPYLTRPAGEDQQTA